MIESVPLVVLLFARALADIARSAPLSSEDVERTARNLTEAHLPDGVTWAAAWGVALHVLVEGRHDFGKFDDTPFCMRCGCSAAMRDTWPCGLVPAAHDRGDDP